MVFRKTFSYNSNLDNKIEIYEKVKASYNKTPSGADLLFLCRSCYGGVVRFRQKDGYMSTPCGVHDPVSGQEFFQQSRYLARAS